MTAAGMRAAEPVKALGGREIAIPRSSLVLFVVFRKHCFEQRGANVLQFADGLIYRSLLVEGESVFYVAQLVGYLPDVDLGVLKTLISLRCRVARPPAVSNDVVDGAAALIVIAVIVKRVSVAELMLRDPYAEIGAVLDSRVFETSLEFVYGFVLGAGVQREREENCGKGKSAHDS
jgi:hypothetical protein